jgi:hypothetical protein
MDRFEKPINRLNTWAEFFRNLKEVGELFGVTPASIGVAILPTILLVGSMIYQFVPWYWIVVVAIFTVGAFLHLFAGVKKARAVKGIKRLSLDVVAQACETFEERYWNFLEAQKTELRAMNALRYGRFEDRSTAWDQERQLEEETMRRMKERLGSEVGALVAMLTPLGINAESDFRSLHWSDELARYYGAIGKLLKRGLLEEAQKLDRHKLFF